MLEAQAERGFAHVSESACELYLGHENKELPSNCEGNVGRKTALVARCIAAITPGLTDEEATQRINRGYLEENPNCYDDVLVDADHLCEVVEKSEAKVVTERAAKARLTKASRVLVCEARQKVVAQHFKRAAAPKYTAAQKKTPRWLPPRDERNTERITEWIDKHIPAPIVVVCDDYNGRWRVISENLAWKSISWTKRGYEAAALEVVHQAWQYHEEDRGVACPFDLGELRKRFSDAAASDP